MDTSIIMDVVTVDNDPRKVLSTKAMPVTLDEQGLKEAADIIKHLTATMKSLLPAAGLAAPQIGFSKRIFIFSYDRTIDNIEVVINPSFEPISDERDIGWEACFSTILGNSPYKIAEVPRYRRIVATYYDLDGKKVTKIMEGFSARLFLHEYDHLEGTENIHRHDAKVKSFSTKEEVLNFMTEVRKNDRINYIPPRAI